MRDISRIHLREKRCYEPALHFENFLSLVCTALQQFDDTFISIVDQSHICDELKELGRGCMFLLFLFTSQVLACGW